MLEPWAEISERLRRFRGLANAFGVLVPKCHELQRLRRF